MKIRQLWNAEEGSSLFLPALGMAALIALAGWAVELAGFHSAGSRLDLVADQVAAVGKTSQPMSIANFPGSKNLPITSRPNCVFALDPSGESAIKVDLLATVSSNCGIVDESEARNALSCNLPALIAAPQIEVAGGVLGFFCDAKTTLKTAVVVPSHADPLGSLPTPPVPLCGRSLSSPYHGASAPITVRGNATLYPDFSYCGGITILSTANVTFMPGTYVLKSGGISGLQGGLTVSLLANVTGNGVTFYNLGPKGGITMLAPSVKLGGVNLVAPTTGAYSCVLFFQDRKNTSEATILGSGDWNTVLEGAYYFPNARVLYGATMPVDYNFLVAKDIEFTALSYGATSLTSSFMSDSSSVPNGCPLLGQSADLVH